MMKNDYTNRTANNLPKLKVALYHYQACPFCALTRQAIGHLEKGSDSPKIEQRDILKEPGLRKELIRGGGKPQVPCLKIEKENGTIQWLYESRDIIKYLQLNYAELDKTVGTAA